MLREHRSLLKFKFLVADLAITTFSFFISYWLRATILMPWFQQYTLFSLAQSLKILLMILPLWLFLFNHIGVYNPVKVLNRYTVSFGPVVKVNLLGILISLSLAYLFKVTSINRTFILLFISLNCIFLTLWRFVVLLFLNNVFFKESDFRQILIVGPDIQAQHLIDTIDRLQDWGIKVVGHVTSMAIAPIEKYLTGNIVDDVIFITTTADLSKMEDQLSLCERMGIGAHVVSDWFNYRIGKAYFDEFHSIPCITFKTVKQKDEDLVLKKVLDVLVSFMLILLFLPIMVAIAVAIKLTSKGSIFYVQTRSGLNGRPFKFYKFRTMVTGAESKLDKLKDFNEMNGPVFKMKKDPRVIGIGRFLRQTSLDELPQLWNVLKGDMSLVGPRPPLPSEVVQYELWQRRRLSITPGITCLWQISGRNEIDFDKWMRLDLDYIDNWSLWLDIKILLLTIPAVLLRRGAR